MVVKWETGIIPPNIEALIRTKTIVGITKKVDILGDRRVVNAHVAYFSALFTCYSGIDHFEMIEDRVLKLLHKKINLGGEHVHLFKLVNLAGAGTANETHGRLQSGAGRPVTHWAHTSVAFAHDLLVSGVFPGCHLFW
jgi:hypothetical protein